VDKIRHIFAALNRRERIALAISALLVAGSAVGLSVFFVVTTTRVVPASGGAYREGVVGQPKAVNPVFAVAEPDTDLVRLTFSNLAELAERVESDAAKRVWNVRLKEGLLWSDGSKLTSDDAIFTVERIQDPESRSPFFSSWQGVTAQRMSELEIQFTLVAPYPFFEEHLRRLYVVPKHIFAETPSTNWHLSDYMLAPVGSGPYRFKKYDRKSNGFITAYHLEPNPHYSQAPPYITEVSFLFFQNENELIDAFNSGALDGFGTFDDALLSPLARPYRLTEFTLPSYYAVFLNQSQNLALKDPDVRNALGLATDRARLVKEILHGHGDPASDPVVPHRAERATVSFASANALLDAAGWQRGADGVREKKVKGGAIRLEFTLTAPDIPLLAKTAGSLEDAWRDIGVKLALRLVSPNDVSQKILKTRDYQALLFGNVVIPPRDLYPFWHSNERFYPGLNLSLYSSKRADQLMEQVRRDPEGIDQKLEALRGIIAGDAPAVFLFSPHYLLVTRKDVSGIPSAPIGEPEDRFLTLPKWYVKTTRTRVTGT